MIAAALQKGSDSKFTVPSPPPPSNLPSPPFLSIQGIHNFRDLGHYPCQPPSSPSFPPGKSYITRPGILFRSAQPTSITPHGAATLTGTLHVRKIYDLRSRHEVQAEQQTISDPPAAAAAAAASPPPPPPPPAVPSLQRIPVPVFADQDLSPAGLARKYKNYTDRDQDGDGYSAGYVRAYRDILLAGAKSAYRRLFEHIRDCDVPPLQPDSLLSEGGEGVSRPEPMLFHCAAGKDRTGVFAALVLRLCGVADEVIAWEYGITERGLGEWREFVVRYLMEGGGLGLGGERPRMGREEAERAVGSREGNMRAFLRVVLDGEVGGVERYMREFCGFSEGDLAIIRGRLVVEGESVFGDGSGYWRTGEVIEGARGEENEKEREREREQKI